MEIKGKLFDKMPIQQVTDSFKKQEFVLEVAENPQYPELIKIESIQDKCGDIDDFDIGAIITASCNLKGRKWDDPQGGVKYFNTIQAWRITGDNSARSTSGSSAQDDDSDDLPF